jgi:hypothetical protein
MLEVTQEAGEELRLGSKSRACLNAKSLLVSLCFPNVLGDNRAGPLSDWVDEQLAVSNNVSNNVPEAL